jgi:putative inorganic carbon (HCO3(-)) transporter
MLFIHERRARWPLLAAGVAGLIGLLALGGPAAAIGLAGRVVGNDIGAKVIQRQELWYYGLLAIQSFPFTGMGLNAFRHTLPLLYPTVPLPAGFDITHVHNHLLQAAINFGLPGLVAYLGLWLGAGYALWSVYRRSADPWLRAAALGLAAGLAAEFIYGTTDVIDFGAKLGLFFWFSLALSISLYQVSNPSNPSH